MAIHIQRHTEDRFSVNDKPVRLDSEGNWIALIELTQFEREAFFKHINAQPDPQKEYDDWRELRNTTQP